MSAHSIHPYEVDLNEKCEEGLQFHFTCGDLQRIHDLISALDRSNHPPDKQNIGYLKLNIQQVGEDDYIAHIDLSLELSLPCGYCLKPTMYLIQDKARIEISAVDQASAYVCNSERKLDVLDLFEEEALLRWPISPKHADCNLDKAMSHISPSFGRISAGCNEAASETWRPFADIHSLADSS